jgi:DNA primase
LPEGQDPDDLARAGGRAAIEEVLSAAQPLAQVLWSRETEAGAFDTPERRAALEARIGTVTAAIGDDAVRKYYRRDFGQRLHNLFAPVNLSVRRERDTRGAWMGGPRGAQSRRPGGAGERAPFGRGQPYVVASAQLAAGPLHRGHRSAIPRREALILQMVLNHPWLLHDHMEDLAAIDFRHAEAGKAKGAMIDVFADAGAGERERMREELTSRGFADLLGRIARAITTASVWGVQPEAAADDVVMTFRQLVALHRQWHSLLRELKDAEIALGQDNSEANFTWLQDVKARLAAIEGTEALIEGFGAASGRPARSL